jgi:hypothetical protein
MDERSERLELVATVLLGIATATSAWCTYQAQLWDSEQLEDMARASKLQSESLRATDVATRNAVVDATTFAYTLEADARGDHRLARYWSEVARPEFRPALRTWLADRAKSSTQTTPFENPEYRAAVQKPAQDLGARADTALEGAFKANHNSDLFGMRTVMVALSLFFLGIAGQLKARGARRLALGFGALVLIVTLVSLTRLPRAGAPRLRSAPLDTPAKPP